MPEFVTLSCPSCGAKLQIGNSVEQFACSHCGNEHVVQRQGGIISLAPVLEQLKGVRTGVDKTASELAIARLKREMEIIKDAEREVKRIQDRYKYPETDVPASVNQATMRFTMDYVLETMDHKERRTFLGLWKTEFNDRECNERWYSLSVDELKTVLVYVQDKLADYIDRYGNDDSHWKDPKNDLERLILLKEKIGELPQLQNELEKHLKIVAS